MPDVRVEIDGSICIHKRVLIPGRCTALLRVTTDLNVLPRPRRPNYTCSVSTRRTLHAVTCWFAVLNFPKGCTERSHQHNNGVFMNPAAPSNWTFLKSYSTRNSKCFYFPGLPVLPDLKSHSDSRRISRKPWIAHVLSRSRLVVSKTRKPIVANCRVRWRQNENPFWGKIAIKKEKAKTRTSSTHDLYAYAVRK